jgi:hypothetical protein
MEETSFFPERPTQPPCNSSLIKRLILSRVGNTRTGQLISNHQVNLPTYRFGAPTPTGGNLSKLVEITFSTQEARSLTLLEV